MKLLTRKFVQTALLSSSLVFLSACGGGSGGTEGSIDMAEYLPSVDMTKHYGFFERSGAERLQESEVIETITIAEIDGHTVVSTHSETREPDGSLRNSIDYNDTVNDTNITGHTLGYGSAERFVNLGDSLLGGAIELFPSGIETDDGNVSVFLDCKIIEKMESVSFGELAYEGEILKIECTMGTEHSFVIGGVTKNFNIVEKMYLKKDIGTIAASLVFCQTEIGGVSSDPDDMAACPVGKDYMQIKLLDPEDS